MIGLIFNPSLDVGKHRKSPYTLADAIWKQANAKSAVENKSAAK
jgi:hypothetical protein